MLRMVLSLCVSLIGLGLWAQPSTGTPVLRGELEIQTTFAGVLATSLDQQVAIRLRTAWWALMGEPVEDLAVSWAWKEGPALDRLEVGTAKGGDRPVRVGDLRRSRPDLYRRFLALQPTGLEVLADVRLYDQAGGGNAYPFAFVRKTLRPDTFGPAGLEEPLHVPGSGSWARFFQTGSGWRGTHSIAPGTQGALGRFLGGPDAEDPAQLNRLLFKLARRVHLQLPAGTTTIRLEWPQADLRMLAEAFARPLQADSPTGPLQSLLLLIDVSGSMNDDGRLPAAKAAAIKAARDAIAEGGEVAVLAFSGQDGTPIRATCPLTRDADRATSFVQSLTAGGGTPLAAALEEANRYLARSKAATSTTQMVILLADGEGTGDVQAVLASLKREGISFRHEAIGLGVPPGSGAATQLQGISRATGGGYHPAASAAEVSRAFADAAAAQKMLGMVGGFGGTPRKQPAKPPAKQEAPSGLSDLFSTW